MHAWEASESCHLSAQKAYLAASADPAYMMAGQDAAMLPSVPELPPKPVPLRLQVQDVTSQKLAYLCSERPAGLLCNLDEGRGWFAKVTDNRTAENRSTWTQSYESKPHMFDRVGQGSLLIENFSVSMFVAVQPAVIEDYIVPASTDGLMQRFIPYIVPDSEASCVGVGRPAWLSQAGAWEHCLRRIHVATKGGRNYTLCAKGIGMIEKFEAYLEHLKHEERIISTDPNIQSAIGKLLGQVGRMIFRQHLIEDPDAIVVPSATVARVLNLVENYTIPSIRHFYMIGDIHESYEIWVASHILTGSEEIISVSEIVRAARRPLEKLRLSGWQANELTESVLIMLSHPSTGWLMALPRGPGEKSARYAVNVVIRERFADKRQQVAGIKQARLDASRDIIRKVRPDLNYQGRIARGWQEAA